MPRPARASTDRLYDPPPHYQPSKLTPRQRDDIVRRLADHETPQALATEYGVTAATIRRYR